MRMVYDERCLGYETPGHPERAWRVEATRSLLLLRHSQWTWSEPPLASEESILLAHSLEHLGRLRRPVGFDSDTDYHPGIETIARLAAGATLSAIDFALAGEPSMALMRPPGHHAERETAMGFCYLNHVAIGALEALRGGVSRVAVWDFDAHHGNGTEAILAGVPGSLYVSCHQSPGYPGTGLVSKGNCLNYPVAPVTPAADHMVILGQSWQALIDFQPELVLVSAGFDAYANDPITQMSLLQKDFAQLGTWLREAGIPAAATLEGGYSADLPELVDAFLTAWSL